jgi:outer membrane protein, multidrug efflux system
MNSVRPILFTFLALLALASCSVGPNYHRPQATVPADWTEVGSGGTNNRDVTLIQWWTTFNDAELDRLINQAVRTNYDLQAAEARVRTARALRSAVVADFLPTVDAVGSLTRARRSANSLAFPVSLLDTDTYQVGFDASWEIDIFGGKRRALEAARAELQAVEEDRRAVLVSLLAEVARNYVDLRGAQARIAIARQNLTAQEEVLQITQLRFDKGLASELDVSQAKSVLATTQSEVPDLETAAKQASHRLAVLMGQPPGAFDSPPAPDRPIPSTPPEVPTGLPSDLLRRRPDIRQSERQLAAANARIGVATAELFPKFFLTGLAGFQSLKADNLISPASEFWSVGPSVRWRLLEYPRLRAQIRAQTGQQEQALAQFNQTVLTALEDVENALVAYGKEKERYRSINEAVAANRRSLDLANQLYTKGLGEFINVLLAERLLYQSEDALVQSRRTVTVNLVALYKALGGGWEAEGKTN